MGDLYGPARYDERTGWVLVLCAIDNLVKGASGQGVECFNIAFGLDRTAALTGPVQWP